MTVKSAYLPLSLESLASGVDIDEEFNKGTAAGTRMSSYQGTTWYTDTNQTGTFPYSNMRFSDFYGKRKDSPITYQVNTLGQMGKGLMLGAGTTSGGGWAQSLYLSVNGENIGAYLYKQGETGYYNYIDFTFDPDTQTSYPSGLGGAYFPLVPSIYGWNGAQWVQHRYSLGTCAIPGSYTLSDVPIFVFRSPNSKWTNSDIQFLLGLTDSQVAKVVTAERVWCSEALTGHDNIAYLGLATCKFVGGSTYQNIWNTKVVKEIFVWGDYYAEWGNFGFTYNPTVTISGATYSITNTNYNAYSITGLTYRNNGGPFRSFSPSIRGNSWTNTYDENDYTVTLGPDDLVFPVMYTDRGFSGGAFGLSTRDPMQLVMKYVQRI